MHCNMIREPLGVPIEPEDLPPPFDLDQCGHGWAREAVRHNGAHHRTGFVGCGFAYRVRCKGVRAYGGCP
jgi:hypothetical protein